MELIRVKIYKDQQTDPERLLIRVPENITAGRLLRSLRKKLPEKFHTDMEYGVFIEIPFEAPLMQPVNPETTIFIIKPLEDFEDVEVEGPWHPE